MADTLDVLTYEEGVQALNLSQSRPAPDALEMWITAISRRIDARAGAVVKRTVTDTLTPDGALLTLSTKPIDSVTTVTEYAGGIGTVLTAETVSASGTYLVRDDTIARRSGFSTSKWYGESVVVEYVAGLFDNTASVGADYKMVASSILRRLWAREAGAWSRANPFDDETGVGSGFFKVIDSVIDEWLDVDVVVGIA